MSCNHTYSRAIFQEYPRLCQLCGEPEQFKQETNMPTARDRLTLINLNNLKLVQFPHPDYIEGEKKLTWEKGFTDGWNAALDALQKGGHIYVEPK